MINNYLKIQKILLSVTLILLPPISRADEIIVTNKEKIPIIKVGAILSLSGPGTLWGNYGLDAIKLAKEELEKEKNIKIELFIEDSKTTAKNTVLAYQKLTKVSGADVIIGDVWNHLVEPLIPLSKQDKNLVIGATYTETNPTVKSDYFFALGDKTELAEDAITNYFKNNPQIKTMSIFSEESSWGQGYVKLIEKVAQKNGIKILSTYNSSDYSYDFKTECLKVKTENPDLVFMGYFQDRLTKEFKLHQIKPQILTTMDINQFIDQNLLSQNDAKGFYVIHWPVNDNFKKKYFEQTKHKVDYGAANFYEALRSAVMAFKKDPKNIHLGMKQIKYLGATGEIDFRNDFSGNWREAEIYEIK